jgi:ribonuclease HI
MSSNTYYAVHKGNTNGIFFNWMECKKQIDNYQHPIYKKFDNILEAENFVKNGFGNNRDSVGKETDQNSKYFVIKGPKKIDETSCYLLKFDGGANPNPGPTGAGAVLFTPVVMGRRQRIVDSGLFIKNGTNNIGEYNGLKLGLEEAIRFKIKNLVIQGDSKLVVYQVTKRWKINNEYIKKINEEISKLVDSFDSIAIKHVYREENVEADAICNEVLSEESNIYKKYN